MDKLLALLCFILGIGTILAAYPDGNAAVLVVILCSVLIVVLIHKLVPEKSQFLTRIFLVGLLARLSFGLFIHVFDFRDFFGGDAGTYDGYGFIVMESWFGRTSDLVSEDSVALRLSGIGRGMLYLVAAIYAIVGRNILAAQFFCAVVGAAIAPLLYVCSFKIFNNVRVSKVSAILAAVFPAFVIWTGQLLKDGLIIFLIVLAITMVIQLQKKFSYISLAVLLFSMVGIISLRFYIFYMISLAVVGTFIVGFKGSSQSILARILMLGVIGVGLTYLGVIRSANADFDKFGSLARIQNSREGLASADSGFAKDIDVSTTEGAITAIPIGLVYLFLAPFPWSLANLRQAITLPDIIVWYASIPFLIYGLMYSIKHRLRPALGILIFSVMLSLGYSLFQGNVGTAYRQRCQIQVFLFIFVGVGWTVFQEHRENRKALLKAENHRSNSRILGRSIENPN